MRVSATAFALVAQSVACLERVPLWCNVECVSNHRRLSRELSASHGHAPLLTPRAVSFEKELNC